jgi:hypothetical protein
MIIIIVQIISQALATLSSSSAAGTSSSPSPQVSKCYLFGLGARWGIGHSTGLLVVGGIFILKDVISDNDNNNSDDSDTVMIPDWLTRMFESFVGLFMLALGFYGIYEAHRIKNGYTSVGLSSGGIDSDGISNNNDNNTAATSSATTTSRRYTDDGCRNGDEEVNDSSCGIHDSNSRSNFEIEPTTGDDSEDDSSNSDGNYRPEYETFDDDLEEFRYNVQVVLGTVSTSADNEEGADGGEGRSGNGGGHSHHRHHDHGSNSPFLALCAGIFHGLAGPGGVLGVVPAIQLHDAGLAACYLLSFCASSTLTMGTFAAAYGTFTTFLAECCSKNSKRRKPRRRRSSSINTRNITTIIGQDENGFADNGDFENGDDSSEASEAITAVAIVEFWIRCVSASLSVLVGVVWLVLLTMGKLEDVFG